LYNPKIIKINRTTKGYVYFCDKNHPLAYKEGMVYLHRHIASLKIGRWLHPDECVHHIDGDITNNEPNNLLITTNSEHTHIHARTRYSITMKLCKQCGKLTKNKTYCSNRCMSIANRVKERPSKDVLKEDLKKLNNWCAIGRKYGVSDNTIRKWAKAYNLNKE